MSNYLEILMIIVALLLAVVIWALSAVLAMMAKKVVEHSKQVKKALIIILITSSSLFTNNLFAQNLNVTDTTSTITKINYGGMTTNSFWTLSTVIGLELLVVLLLIIFIKGLWTTLYPTEKLVTQMKISNSWLITTWNKLDKQFFTKAAPIEQEADILLDHNYDGIKELDNALPPWWKYGFYITIVVAVFYLLKFEVWKTGQNQIQEYTTEMTEAKAATEAYLASQKENVDEKTVVMADAAGIATGKTLFAKTCVACHMSNGEGGVGPNLTDEYWIHGGSINDVFKTIKYGYPDKGMQSWSSTYSPVQIQQLASFIKSLKGTHPANAKAPQGDLYIDATVKDTVKLVVTNKIISK